MIQNYLKILIRQRVTFHLKSVNKKELAFKKENRFWIKNMKSNWQETSSKLL